VGRIGGQIRVAPSGAILGWDVAAALTLASALGVPGVAVAELLPAIEAVMAAKLNERLEQEHG